MKLSRKFLNEYIDTKEVSNIDLAEAMTHVGNEYESITPLSSATNLIIGYIQECIDHPDSDHLHVCQVEIASNEVVQIVCGAPNVKKGIKVIVSLPGAVLPGGFEIKKSTIRGQESYGMICSLGELGIESKYQSEEDKIGIHILDEDAPLGSDALKYLGFDDVTIDFELTSNRSDLLSVIGMAYEVGAILDEKVKLPDMKIQREVESVKDYLKLSVETEKCSLYLAKMVKNVTIQDSPKWLKARLMASGIRPINNVVDISNYIMLETGQPLHFFDYKTLGNEIIVRTAKDGEKITTLDNQERTLIDHDIVIANRKQAVALAGVMGGLNSEVENDTTDIVIESAVFNPTNIRLTAKRVLRSEASSRFEKGLDPNRSYMAIIRACKLLEEMASGTVIGDMLVHDVTAKEEKTIEITRDKINTVLGMNLTNDDILEVFKKLNFAVTEKEELFTVTVPTRRLDIAICEDLIEEVGRIHGIENVSGKLPVGTGKNGNYEKNYLKEKEIRARLLSLGLNQVRTYTLTKKEHVHEFTLDDFEPIVLQDPMTEEREYARYSLIPSLYQVANYNMSRKVTDIMIHEISNIYYMYQGEVVEKSFLAGLLTGKSTLNEWQHIETKIDFYYAKGVVENLLNYLGFTNRFAFEVGEMPKEFHPYQSAVIKLDRNIIGYIGMIHPMISKTPIFVFEIDLSKVYDISVRPIKDKEITKYPSISKDVAFAFDQDIVATDVIKTIQKTGGRLLDDINIFDVYQGEHIEANKKSIAFNLTFMDVNRTLNDDEVMEIFEKIIKAVIDTHHGVLRDK